MAIVLPKFPNRRLSAARLSTRSFPARRVEPAVNLRLLTLQAALEPGEELEFEYQLAGIANDEVEGLEASVLWYTEGKGGEDFGVHFFQKQNREELIAAPLEQPRRFSTPLPASPLSYEGKLIKLRWCVRIRLFLQGGKELSAQRAFYLGHLTVEV